jgi:hypothetical protein
MLISYKVNECYYIAPLLDLFKIKIPTNFKEEEVIKIKTQISHGKSINFSYLSIVERNTILLKETPPTPSNEKMYLDYGIYTPNNIFDFYTIVINIDRLQLGDHKMQICYNFGCGGLDMSIFQYVNQTEHGFYIFQNQTQLNQNLLAYSKLLAIEDPNPDIDYYSKKLASTEKLNFFIEIKGHLNYLDIITNSEKGQIPLLELMKSLRKLNENEIKKRNLYQIAYKKQSLLLEDKVRLINEVENEILSQMKEIKFQYLIKDF